MSAVFWIYGNIRCRGILNENIKTCKIMIKGKKQPSILAATALHLSQLILPGNIKWSPAQQHDSGYTYEKLRPLVCQLASVLEANPTGKLMAIRDKYRFNSYFKYSSIDNNIVKIFAAKIHG